jgi:hypothetical protein
VRYLLLLLLGGFLLLAVLIDIQQAVDLYRFGFPPTDLTGPNGVDLPVTWTDKLVYALFVFVLAGAHVLLVRLIAKVWRRAR